MKYKSKGRVIKPSATAFLCENCKSKTIMMYYFEDENGEKVLRCHRCMDIKDEDIISTSEQQ